MPENKCERCYYHGMCGGEEPCSSFQSIDIDYDEIVDEDSDEYINKIIENGRNEFTEEWLQYIGEDE